MFEMPRISIFSQTKLLENKIDQFHDKLFDCSVTFKKIIKEYIENQASSEFKKLHKQLKTIENDADRLRRDIEAQLYIQNLIPDLRADVLNMVENLDKIINRCDTTAHNLYIEKPVIPEEYNLRFIDLIEVVTSCIENSAIASRAFFRDFAIVRDYSIKVFYKESEADKICANMKEVLFNSNLELAHKLHLRDIVDSIDMVADITEDAMDDLAIFTIKRDI